MKIFYEIKTIMVKDFWMFRKSKQKFAFLGLILYFVFIQFYKGDNSFISPNLLMFLIPNTIGFAISGQMGSTVLSGERKSGMLELLLLSKIKKENIVFGKNLFATIVGFLFTIIFLLIIKIGTILIYKEEAQVFSNLILFVLLVMCYLGASGSIFMSIIVKNEITAPIIMMVFFIIIGVLEYYLVFVYQISKVLNIGILTSLCILFTMLSIYLFKNKAYLYAVT